MPKIITQKEYKAKLKAKFGVRVESARYDGQLKPIEHTCGHCGQGFKASPALMLHGRTRPYCTPCFIKTRPKQKTGQEKFINSLAKKFDGVTCTEYVSNHKKSKFRCVCGNTWEAKPYELLKSKHGCPDCAAHAQSKAMRYTIKEIKVLLAKRSPDVQVVDKVRTKKGHVYNRELGFKCRRCSHDWTTNLSAALQYNLEEGCPNCAKNKNNKAITLNGRTVGVQGYEPEAIAYLIEVRKIKESQIKVFKQGKIKPVVYVFKGKAHDYWPDIQVGTKLIEVKSIYTLCAGWDRNVAKAKAAIKQGFAFELLLVHNKKIYSLPDDWIKWKSIQAEAFLRKHTLKKMRILSMDPGVTNFAWSVLEVSRPFKVKLVATGMLEETLKDMTGNVKEKADLFLNAVKVLKEEYEIDHTIMERFMSRGMKGLTIELVNVMLGIMLGSWKKKQRNFKLITAAQWKNEWNRRADLKEFYDKVSCTVHQADSIGIGLYGAAYWFDEEPFKDILKFEKSLLRQIKSTDLMK